MGSVRRMEGFPEISLAEEMGRCGASAFMTEHFAVMCCKCGKLDIEKSGV